MESELRQDLVIEERIRSFGWRNSAKMKAKLLGLKGFYLDSVCS
jgi:hypothetical protein